MPTRGLWTAAAVAAAAAAATATAASSGKNVVFVLTDDQDITLNSLDVMPQVKALLTDRGAYFTNGFATTPICCPSRAEIITGRHMHNTGVTGNDCGGTAFQQGPEKLNVGAYAKDAGYDTFYAGKYLNNYGGSKVGGVAYVPPGFDTGNWNGLVGNSKYYQYTLSVNGKAEHHGDDYAADYLTDLIANRSCAFIAAHAVPGSATANAAGAAGDADAKPFFAMLGTPASHIPDDYAPWTAGMFANASGPRTPNWNHAPNPDKHWMMRYIQPMDGTRDSGGLVNTSDWVVVKRWRTLQSVDVLVGRVVQTLEDAGVLNDTYIIYSSDHGYHSGQFGLGYDKRQLYEEDVRVPLIVRGPGIAAGQSVPQPAAHIDLAPTILDMMGLPVAPQMDGRSWLPLVASSSSSSSSAAAAVAASTWRTEMLIEYGGPHVTGVAYTPSPLSLLAHAEVDVDPVTGALFDMGTPPLPGGRGGGGPPVVNGGLDDPPCKWFAPNSTTPSGQAVPCDPANNTYACVRSLNSSIDADSMYCEFNDDENFVEYYDLTTDPWQLANAAKTADPAKIAALAKRLRAHMACSGASCFDPPPPPAPAASVRFLAADGQRCLSLAADTPGSATQATLEVAACDGVGAKPRGDNAAAPGRSSWRVGVDTRGHGEVASAAANQGNDTLCLNINDDDCRAGSTVHAGPCQAQEAKERTANHFHYDAAARQIASDACKGMCVGGSSGGGSDGGGSSGGAGPAAVTLVKCGDSAGNWTSVPDQ